MTLPELLVAVKAENLPHDLLEKYHDELTHLKSDFQMELIQLKKAKSLFIYPRTVGSNRVSHVAAKDAWNVTAEGGRLIEVEGSLKTVANELSGIRHKLYNSY